MYIYYRTLTYILYINKSESKVTICTKSVCAYIIKPLYMCHLGCLAKTDCLNASMQSYLLDDCRLISGEPVGKCKRGGLYITLPWSKSVAQEKCMYMVKPNHPYT